MREVCDKAKDFSSSRMRSERSIWISLKPVRKGFLFLFFFLFGGMTLVARKCDKREGRFQARKRARRVTQKHTWCKFYALLKCTWRIEFIGTLLVGAFFVAKPWVIGHVHAQDFILLPCGISRHLIRLCKDILRMALQSTYPRCVCLFYISSYVFLLLHFRKSCTSLSSDTLEAEKTQFAHRLS